MVRRTDRQTDRDVVAGGGRKTTASLRRRKAGKEGGKELSVRARRPRLSVCASEAVAFRQDVALRLHKEALGLRV